jgi:hypothetical protein
MKRSGVGPLQTGNLQISPGAKLADSTVGRFEPEGAGVEVCSGALRTRPGALAAAVANPIIHPGTLGAGPGSLTPSVDGSGRAASGTWAPRPTYIVSEPQLRQTIRCATEGDTIEVQRLATHKSGSINGTWRELSRNWSGELSGSVTPNGFKVAIPWGSNSMPTWTSSSRTTGRSSRSFMNSSLIGLTLVRNKG